VGVGVLSNIHAVLRPSLAKYASLDADAGPFRHVHLVYIGFKTWVIPLIHQEKAFDMP
jgi:hypothetical protein